MKPRNSRFGITVAGLCLGLLGADTAIGDDLMKIVSVDDWGNQGSSWSDFPAVSGNGCRVAFVTRSNLDPVRDNNSDNDVYVRDTCVSPPRTVLVSVNPLNANQASGRVPGQPEDYDDKISINYRGCRVAFTTERPLVPQDTSGPLYTLAAYDVYVSDWCIPSSGDPSKDALRAAPLIYLVSKSVGGQAAGYSFNPALTANDKDASSDGRYVAFQSQGAVLGGVLPGPDRIYRYDLTRGVTKLISINSNGVPANGNSYKPAISKDGRYVAFESMASNLDLIIADNNNVSDIFVHDFDNVNTKRVSGIDFLIGGEVPGLNKGPAYKPDISGTGQHVVFETQAKLVADDTNGLSDIYVVDRWASTLRRVSLKGQSIESTLPGSGSFWPSISLDGGYVAFWSRDTGLADRPEGLAPNGFKQVFVRDRVRERTKLISLGIGGQPGWGDSSWAVLSNNGLDVAFRSYASDLVPFDANGITTDVFAYSRRQADLEIWTNQSNPKPKAGDRLTYKLYVKNNGPWIASKGVVVDGKIHYNGVLQPLGAVLVGDTSADCKNPPKINCTFQCIFKVPVNVGQTIERWVQIRPPAGTVSLDVWVSNAAEPDPESGNNWWFRADIVN